MEDIDVYIEVNGQRLEEYLDMDEELPLRTVAKYVVAQSGADFTIVYNFKRKFAHKRSDLRCEIRLDGRRVNGVVLFSKDKYARNGPQKVAESRSYEDGVYLYRKFTFSELMIDEEVEILSADQKKSIDALGEIQLKIWRVKVTSESHAPSDSRSNYSDPVSKAPEKALKGRTVSHHAIFGQARAGRAFKEVDTKWIDPKNEPLAVYIFRYRSVEALKIMGLIPRTPEPVPLEERPIEELTLEETRELLRRQREQTERDRVLKRESQSGTVQQKPEPGLRSLWEDGDDLEVIEERPSKRRKKSDDPIDTVDLTGD